MLVVGEFNRLSAWCGAVPSPRTARDARGGVERSAETESAGRLSPLVNFAPRPLYRPWSDPRGDPRVLLHESDTVNRGGEGRCAQWDGRSLKRVRLPEAEEFLPPSTLCLVRAGEGAPSDGPPTPLYCVRGASSRAPSPRRREIPPVSWHPGGGLLSETGLPG